MKKYFIVLVFLLPNGTLAASINGILSSSQTWTVAGGPYEVDALTIPLGVTLTIEPGAQIVPVLKWSSEPTYIFKVEGALFFGSNTGPKITVTPLNPPLPPYPTNGTLRERLEWAAFGVQIRPSASLFLIQSTGSVILQNTETNNINIVLENKGGIVEVDGLKSRNYQFSIYQRGLYQGGVIKGSTNIINSDFFGRGIQEIDVVGGTLTVHNTKLVGTSNFGSPYNIQAVADLSNNWWGSASGPDSSIFQGTSIIFTPWLTTEPGSIPVGCTANCYSSVMFFPGIMGSKLYEQGTFEGNPTDLQRWSSSNDFNQSRLQMDSNGYSVNNLYTKAATSTNAGVIDEILGQNVYKSFMSDLAQMKASSTIGIDYSLIPYDWRLPLSEIVQKGKVEGGNLYYGATVPNISDSFIIKELQRLADNSKTGKVTIVAHSNGGLVTKELIQTLKESNNPLYEKIDKVIMVAVPQVGTPEAVVGLLHGHGIGPFGTDYYLSNPRSRQLSENMPMSYNLLPNQNYISILDAYALESKVITFDDSVGLAAQRAQYGNLVNNQTELQNYILGTDSRIKPTYENTTNPNIGNAVLYNNANAAHQRIDNFELASTTKLIQIAGWGEDTTAGIDYKSYRAEDGNFYTSYKIRKTVDGDGTVVAPSALYTPVASNSERWWVDLKGYNGILGSLFNIGTKHADILEIPDIRTFIKDTITTTLTTYTHLKSSQPISTSKKLHYTLHSPLTLGILDTQGRYTGRSTSTAEVLNQIPGADYDVYGEVQTVSIPIGIAHTVIIDGYQQGSFSLDIDKQEGNTITASTTFTGIPASTSTIATLEMGAEANIASSTLQIDQDGNGSTDVILANNPVGYVVYDTTPPELKLTFSTSTRDVILSAIDNIDENPTITMGTSTITLKDSQDNTTIINFKKLKDNPTKLGLTYNQIIRNGVPTTTPNARIEYDWKIDNQGSLKDLDTKVFIKGIERNTFNYKKQTNTTTIKTKNVVTGNINTTTRSGFVPVTIITNKDNLLNIDY